uniref:Ninjurin 2 n=1 Tax=Oryzias latipes TaxID=8090 RepID=A0A3B3HSF4_ORYLA
MNGGDCNFYCHGKKEQGLVSLAHGHNLDFNIYATKKSAAQSMLDVALLMANSFQLKIILSAGPKFNFYIPLIVLLAISITLQVVVGLLLIFIAKSNLNIDGKHVKLDRMNNAATIFVFLTVVVNIFITALGFQNDSGWVLTQQKTLLLFVQLHTIYHNTITWTKPHLPFR